MQERVTPMNEDFAEVVVQHNTDLMSVGIGLEPRSVVPNAHFVDAIYGDRENLAEIGKILVQLLDGSNLLGQPVHSRVRFNDSDAEAEWHREIGRAVLDAVTGSKAGMDGLYTWLDRPATNRLIRLLRKARDNAFGRDE